MLLRRHTTVRHSRIIDKRYGIRSVLSIFGINFTQVQFYYYYLYVHRRLGEKTLCASDFIVNCPNTVRHLVDSRRRPVTYNTRQ